MGVNTDFGIFSEQVDMSADTLTAAATMDISAALGNTVFVAGNTTVSSLGTPSQIGIGRELHFVDAPLFTVGANLQLYGGTDFQFSDGDVAQFRAISPTIWKMTSFTRPAFTNGSGQINDLMIAPGAIGALQLAGASMSISKQPIRTVTAWVDTTTAPTAAQVISGIFTAVPTAARAHQLPTATNLTNAAASTGYQLGTAFEFTVVNTAAFDITLTTNTGLTLIGSMVVNNASATFVGVITGANSVTIYRK